MKDEVLSYLNTAYRPLGVIVYGSYADGTQNEQSDFDALVITEDGEKRHDTTVQGGIPLDVFVYPKSHFEGDIDADEILPISDGVILLDTDGTAERIVQAVKQYVAALPIKSDNENKESVAWCEKMLARAARRDAEGLFRHHWLLVDSLEIYCDLTHRRYFGPKKALRGMKQEDPNAFTIYTQALRDGTWESLAAWISHIKSLRK